ncbi:MAG TPA: MarC family protein [Saprospiraceae bacterium]|nr:MarC family protein [Saprospiraceae bacterium]
MDFSVAGILSVTLVLFSVIDIIGSIPIVISLKEKGSLIESGKATLISGVIMIAFLIFGEKLLGLFGVDLESFAIAGGMIIFFIGIEMIMGITLFRDQYAEGAKSTVMPLAFPLIAGAGTMTTIVSLKSEYARIDIIVGIIVNLVFVYLILRSSDWIQRKIGQGGMTLLRKVFGIILLAIAIKLIKSNLNLEIIVH